MKFNKHYALEGHHAFLSASKPSWTNYDIEKLERSYDSHEAAKRGTRLHALAAELIDLGVKLPEDGTTLSLYVNDAIGYLMTPEQTFFVSENCFGTADAASYRATKLRIHDLKTGLIQATFLQLEIYAAMFCMEYGKNPFETEMELRIYQNDEIKIHIPDPDDIMHIMSNMTLFNKRINEMKKEGF